MEIEVKQEKLAKALNIVSRVASSKNGLTILNNVLIRVNGSKVSLMTTNLDMAVVDFLPISEAKDGVVTVPARLLAEFVGNLPKGEVVKIIEKGEKITIKAGKYASTMNGVSAEDFPELPEIDEESAVRFKMSVEDFKLGVNEVVIASSNDTTRPALTGVYFNTFEGALYIAATDGYRLAERKFVKKVESEVKAIVPTASLNEVIRSISDDVEEVEIVFDEMQVRFRLGEVEITSKLIDGSFPDYRQLIPKSTEVEVILPKDELMRVVKLAALFAREVGGSITCETNKEKGVFAVSSVANEYGENDSEIEVEVGGDTKVVLNSRFLQDALNVLSGSGLRLGLSGKLAPVLIKNEKNDDYVHIVMPLKS